MTFYTHYGERCDNILDYFCVIFSVTWIYATLRFFWYCKFHNVQVCRLCWLIPNGTHNNVFPVSSHTITPWECSFLVDFCYFSFYAWQSQERQRQVPKTERKIVARSRSHLCLTMSKTKTDSEGGHLPHSLSFKQRCTLWEIKEK